MAFPHFLHQYKRKSRAASRPYFFSIFCRRLFALKNALVLVNQGIQFTIFFHFLQDFVDDLQRLGIALLYSDGVILVSQRNPQALPLVAVALNQLGRREIVDNNRINTALDQVCYRFHAGVVTNGFANLDVA